MNIKSDKAGTPIVYVFSGGAGLGLAYGVVRAGHLGLIPAILTVLAVLSILYLIFRQGRNSSYSTAQAWAQAQVDIAIEVTNTATAKANALSEALSLAISQANATATNTVNLQLPDVSSHNIQLLQDIQRDNQAIEHSGLYSNEVIDERSDAQRLDVATGADEPNLQFDTP